MVSRSIGWLVVWFCDVPENAPEIRPAIKSKSTFPIESIDIWWAFSPPLQTTVALTALRFLHIVPYKDRLFQSAAETFLDMKTPVDGSQKTWLYTSSATASRDSVQIFHFHNEREKEEATSGKWRCHVLIRAKIANLIILT